MDIESLATAFSTHDFAHVLPHVADDVVWELVGNQTIEGKHMVERLVELTADGLIGSTVTVRSARSVVGDGTVVVDTVTHYDHPSDGVTLVASCDLYDHADGVITRIRSYTVELSD
jgi:ketosteroid isomerase-like protein